MTYLDIRRSRKRVSCASEQSLFGVSVGGRVGRKVEVGVAQSPINKVAGIPVGDEIRVCNSESQQSI